MADNGRVVSMTVNSDMRYRLSKALDAKGHPDLISREELFSYLHPERFQKPNRSPQTTADRNIRWQITACMKRMPGYRYDGGTDNPRFRRTSPRPSGAP